MTDDDSDAALVAQAEALVANYGLGMRPFEPLCDRLLLTKQDDSDMLAGAEYPVTQLIHANVMNADGVAHATRSFRKGDAVHFCRGGLVTIIWATNEGAMLVRYEAPCEPTGLQAPTGTLALMGRDVITHFARLAGYATLSGRIRRRSAPQRRRRMRHTAWIGRS